MFKKRKRINKRGFTLLEMIVVVTIIALIGIFIFIVVENARNRTRDAVIISSLEQIQAIAETVYNPEDGYKELYKMTREDNLDPKIEQIFSKVGEMAGRGFTINFTHEKGGDFAGDYSEYCAYVKLVRDENEFYCIDYLGNKKRVGGSGVEGDGEIECSDMRELSPVSCELRP